MNNIPLSPDRFPLSFKVSGSWQAVPDGIQHAQITDALTDYFEVTFSGDSCVAALSSATGKRIAAVVTLNGKPLTPNEAGSDILYGEGQSYILIDLLKDMSLVRLSEKDGGPHTLRIYTRSDKLICHQIICNQ